MDKTKNGPELDPKIEKNLSIIKRILDIIRGKEDVRNRLSSILDPQNPQTSSILNPDQTNFVVDAYWLAEAWPQLYQPLKDYAIERLYTQLSMNGKGIDSAIKLTGAIEQSMAFKGLFGTTDEKKRRLPSFRKGESKQ